MGKRVSSGIMLFRWSAPRTPALSIYEEFGRNGHRGSALGLFKMLLKLAVTKGLQRHLPCVAGRSGSCKMAALAKGEVPVLR